MMGRRNGQMEALIFNPEDIILQDYLLTKIDKLISFEFIYELLKGTYSEYGRPSIDPVCMVKMLLVDYLFGVKSERRLVEEVSLNIAYRWFCGFGMMDKIPDHSTFSKNRIHRWRENNLFHHVFVKIVQECISKQLVDGKDAVTDGSYIPANVSRESWIDVETQIEFSMQSYLKDLDAELAQHWTYSLPMKKRVLSCFYILKSR